MDKTSKKILDYMISQNKGCSFVCNFQDDLDNMAGKIQIPVEDVRAAVRYLEDEKYVRYSKTSSGRVFGFYLEHKGLHYKDFQRTENITHIINSAVIPFIVAVATALVTSLLIG